MTENMKKFLAAASVDGELAAKAKTMDEAALIAIAKELEIDLAEVDFVDPEEEMSQAELANVAGGGECYCALGGGGTADAYGHVCACVVVGIGANELDDGQDRCVCAAAGYGHDMT